MKIMETKNLKDYLELIDKTPDKVRVFIDIIRQLHNLPEYDNKSIGGRVAGMIRGTNKDYNRIMHVVWETKDRDIIGSRLDYITKVLMKNSKHRDYSQKDVVTNPSQISDRYELKGEIVVDKQTGRKWEKANFNPLILRMLK